LANSHDERCSTVALTGRAFRSAASWHTRFYGYKVPAGRRWLPGSVVFLEYSHPRLGAAAHI